MIKILHAPLVLAIGSLGFDIEDAFEFDAEEAGKSNSISTHSGGKHITSLHTINWSSPFSFDDLSDNKLRVFGEKNTSIFWDMVKGDNSVVLGSAGETDEAVTVDVKRVIRWIGSLHGKCGLRVTEMPLERLNPFSQNHFNPLEESIVFSSDKKFNILLNKDDVTAELAGIRVEGNSGDRFEVTESLATFIVLKGWGSIVN